LPPVAIDDATRAYSNLKSELKAAGLFRRQYRFYAALIAFAFGGYAAAAAGIVAFDSVLPLALASLAFTFFGVQLAGLMHDSGHRAVFDSNSRNDVLGYACAALIGMVFDNWKTRHNMHHAHPNQEDLDPDMSIPFIAISEDDYVTKGALEKRLIRFQALYYFPLGCIVGFSNRLGTITYFLRKDSGRNVWKFALYAAGTLALFVSPFLLFSLQKALFVFFAVHLTSGVYLANCFAPNHKGMPRLGGSERMSFLEQQVITARNVTGGFITDLLLVGLNHQVQHHLFPYTPRNNLPLLKPYVERACARLGIDFTEVGFVETNRILLRELRQVSRAASGALAPALSPAAAE
jgi:fatty acid desaturase